MKTSTAIRHITAALAATLMLAAYAAHAQTGNWSSHATSLPSPSGNTYTITTEGELAALAAAVNEGDNFSGKTIALANNLNLSAHYWTPIGDNNTSARRFSGTLDGQGSTITGLTIATTNTLLYAGLFGYIGSGGKVQNLNLAGTSIFVCLSNGGIVSGDSLRVGGVAGYNYYGTVSNCSNSGSVAAIAYLIPYAGGVVGYAIGNTATIAKCSNSGSVYASGAASAAYAGGVAGYITNGSTLSDSSNSGTVSATAAGCAVGGVAGYMSEGAVVNCVNNGGVSSNYRAGGVVGRNSLGTIKDCVNNGTVSVTSDTYAYVGGVTGWAGGASSTRATVVNCANNGGVTATASLGTAYAGGVTATLDGLASIANCSSSGGVSASSSSSYARAGGVAGVIEYPAGAGCTVFNCVNYGSVSAATSASSSSIRANTFYGGVVGYMEGSLITVADCYWRQATDCEPAGNNKDGLGTVSRVYSFDTAPGTLSGSHAVYSTTSLLEALSKWADAGNATGGGYYGWRVQAGVNGGYPFLVPTYTVATASNPLVGGATSGGGLLAEGVPCTVTATANSGYAFVSWTEGSEVVSTLPTYAFTVTGNRVLTANFVQAHIISVSTSPTAGGAASGGGTLTNGVSCTVTAAASLGYTFQNWTEGPAVVSTLPAYTFTVTGARTLTAHFTANTYTVTFDSQGGSAVASKSVTFGSTYGALSSPRLSGYTFAGWFTATAGGAEVTALTIVTTASNHTLYAQWTLGATQDPYLDDPGSAGGSPATLTTAYDGFLYDTNHTVRGTMTLNAKAAFKKNKDSTVTTNWTFSAKVLLQTASVSFSGKWTNDFTSVTLKGKKNEILSVTPGTDTFHGTYTDGSPGTTSPCLVAGSRNAFLKKSDPRVPLGLYNVALLSTTPSAGASTPSPEKGIGYVTLTAANAGAVKIAGKLADGSSFSGSARLLEGLNEDGWMCVALHRPLYSKKGFIGGLLWLDPVEKVIRVDSLYEWFVDWACDDAAKASNKEAFAERLDVFGGFFNPSLVPTTGMYFSADVPTNSLPVPATLDNARWMDEAFPSEIPASGTKLTLEKSPAPAKDKTTGLYGYTGVNPSGATLTYTAKTGLFKGSFKIYYDGDDPKSGKPQHKTVSVPHSGVMITTADGLTETIGLGTGTATINKQKIGVPVGLTEN